MSRSVAGEAGVLGGDLLAPIRTASVSARASRAYTAYLTRGAAPETRSGAHVGERVCALPSPTGNGRRRASLVLALPSHRPVSFARRLRRGPRARQQLRAPCLTQLHIWMVHQCLRHQLAPASPSRLLLQRRRRQRLAACLSGHLSIACGSARPPTSIDGVWYHLYLCRPISAPVPRVPPT